MAAKRRLSSRFSLLLLFVVFLAPIAVHAEAQKIHCEDVGGQYISAFGPCECKTPGECSASADTRAATIGQNKIAYFPLAPIPGVTTGKADLPTFLNNLFKLLVAGAAALAVVMIVIGGFEYLSSAVPGSKEAGRQHITNAIVGLAILLSAYLLIRAINPELLNFRLFLEPVVLQRAAEPTLSSSTPPGSVNEAKRAVETSSTADAQKARDQYLAESRGAQKSADEEAKKLYARGFVDDKSKDRSLQYYPRFVMSPTGSTIRVIVHRYFLKHRDGTECIVTPISSRNGKANVFCEKK